MVANGDEVRQMVNGMHPRPIRRYYVEINGIQFPAKQVLERLLEAKKVGLFAADVTSRDANRVLRALGFEVMAMSNQGGE